MTSSGRTPRVLVVDDEQRLRDMLVRSAEELGFVASDARSAEPASKIIEQGLADIVILDLNLPGMGGIELLAKIRRASLPIQVIILTGFGTLEAARRAIRLDAVDFLTKPCPLEDLEMALAKARQRWLESLVFIPEPSTADVATESVGKPLTLEELERIHILAALDRNGGNRAVTAAELGISERTLYYRIGQYQRAGHVL